MYHKLLFLDKKKLKYICNTLNIECKDSDKKQTIIRSIIKYHNSFRHKQPKILKSRLQNLSNKQIFLILLQYGLAFNKTLTSKQNKINFILKTYEKKHYPNLRYSKEYFEKLTNSKLDYFLDKFNVSKTIKSKNAKIATIVIRHIKQKQNNKRSLKVVNETIKNKSMENQINSITYNNILLKNKSKYRVIVLSNGVESWIKTEDLIKILRQPTNVFYPIVTIKWTNNNISQNVITDTPYFNISIPFNAIIDHKNARKLVENPNKFAKFKLIDTKEKIGELISHDIYKRGGTAVGAFHGHTNLFRVENIS